MKDLVRGSKNIFAASKVSNNCIIVHLEDSSILNKFMTQYGSFTIENDTIK